MGKVTVRLELNSRKYVVVRFTRDGAYKKIATGVVSSVDHFNKDRFGRWVSKADPDHERKNRLIEESLSVARNALDAARKVRNAEPVLDEVDRRTRQGHSYSDLFSYCEQVATSFANWNQLRAWKTFLNKLKGFMEFEDRTQYDFREVDTLWLSRFDSWMASNGLASGTRHTQLKRLRTAFNKAISDRLVPAEVYPFTRRGFQMPRLGTAVKKRLTVEQLRMLANYKPIELPWAPIKTQIDARDTFITQFYLAGARIEDILRLRVGDIGIDRVTFSMSKTQLGRSYPLAPQLKALLYSRLEGREKSEYVFPWLKGLEDATDDMIKACVSKKTAVVNKALRKIAKKLGFEFKVTTHIARHSFAQHLVEQDTPVKVIQELLGHQNLSVTQRYIDQLNVTKTDSVMMSLPTL